MQFDPTINTLHAHLCSLEETTDKLKACGIEIHEDLKIITFFASLPTEYNTSITHVVSSLKVAGRDPSLIHSKTEFVTNLLLSKESRCIEIQGKWAPHKVSSQAIPQPCGKRLCYICQSPDHYQANCPTVAKPSETVQELINMIHQDLPNSEDIAY
ncbi:hypothetical protein BS47DRAFT_1399723 [Hydnum rufescens UP504]|uniref:CCHC-type domain-containing protein n=1 Tax=Hydnum rufescens UP504 TaxID=1448309 RepID=A0A9P6DPC5_9AGAM|nr:hypothetical protein BS47DRAFT_1399723 [Hydnum rufescens UP504]